MPRSIPAGDRAAFMRARWALIAATVIAVTPTPLSAFWGSIATSYSWMVWPLAALWLVAAYAERRFFDPGNVRTPFPRKASPALGYVLVIDVVFLTALLAVSGAAENPFALLFFVPITLSTLLSQGWTVRIALLAVLGFGALLAVTVSAGLDQAHHNHHVHFLQHVQGMAVALATSGLLVTVFAHRIARAFSRQRAEIAKLTREQEADRVATSLGAIAAGAAHELGSPLATVQLLAEDLLHMTEDEQREAVGDIAVQVIRMKDILHGMDSGVLSGQMVTAIEPWNIDELGDELPRGGDIEVNLKVTDGPPTTQPRSVLEQIFRELIENASKVCPDQPLDAELSSSDNGLRIAVHDRGPGFTEDQAAQAVEPFVSATGGRGLGLFLAHVHARQLGGALLILPRRGGGASVELHLPLSPPSVSSKPPPA